MKPGEVVLLKEGQSMPIAFAATDEVTRKLTDELAVKTVTERAPSPRLIGRLSSAERKEYPVTTGFIDYFPDAMALVSHVSWAGNEKHNPGEPLHWARGKSTDQPDCVGRHLMERDGSDFIKLPDGREVEIPHRAAMAWRAMAELQLWAEQTYGLGMAPGASE